jgi:hypothetical protein
MRSTKNKTKTKKEENIHTKKEENIHTKKEENIHTQKEENIHTQKEENIHTKKPLCQLNKTQAIRALAEILEIQCPILLYILYYIYIYITYISYIYTTYIYVYTLYICMYKFPSTIAYRVTIRDAGTNSYTGLRVLGF